ncbi:unnamed protein product [Fraxinus pennsylvanica]|uniref:V-type proton ATPase subunit C n=1 Tax=Fraxinus pennsylvanica TaxID=56036 RepID=A0AAD1YVI4_9LAMI|nr:unnamed protein product [Fraxinus pennsylvanica]
MMLTTSEQRHVKEISKNTRDCGEVFSSWMHFGAVRVFTESILRYVCSIVSPSVKSEKKVRSILEGLCDSSNSTYWKNEDEGGMGGFAGDADAHPYVSFTINFI